MTFSQLALSSSFLTNFAAFQYLRSSLTSCYRLAGVSAFHLPKMVFSRS